MLERARLDIRGCTSDAGVAGGSAGNKVRRRLDEKTFPTAADGELAEDGQADNASADDNRVIRGTPHRSWPRCPLPSWHVYWTAVRTVATTAVRPDATRSALARLQASARALVCSFAVVVRRHACKSQSTTKLAKTCRRLSRKKSESGGRATSTPHTQQRRHHASGRRTGHWRPLQHDQRPRRRPAESRQN